MFDDPRSHGLWAFTAPPAPDTAPLAGDLRAEVAIVGAGFTGLSAALHLAEGGLDACVIEAREVGHGGSGRNVGLVNAGLWVMPDDVPRVLGDTHGERLLAALSEAPNVVFGLIARYGIACEAERAGTLHCAVGAGGLDEIGCRARQWGARGAPVRLLDAAEAARAIGSRAYPGALHDARAGTVQPLAYVRGLCRAALERGARVFTGSPVVAADPAPDGWRVRTPGGSVTARHVIVATDAYGADLPWGAVAREQVPLPYFQVATAPLGHNVRASVLPGREGAWDTKDILSSFRLDRAGRLVFGSVGALRGTGAAVHAAWARRSIRRLFPQVGEVAFENLWWGRIGMTADAVPRLHVLAPGVLGVSGYNGRGIAPGTTFGRLLALHLLGRLPLEDMPLPVTDAEPDRLRGLKGAYYELGAQVAHAAGERGRGA